MLSETAARNISSAELAILVPLSGYYGAYRFEMGYCRHWGIPASFIRLDGTNLTQIATASLGLLLFLFGTESFARGILTLLPPAPPNRSGRIAKALAPIFVVSCILIAYNLLVNALKDTWIVDSLLAAFALSYVIILIAGTIQYRSAAKKTPERPLPKAARSIKTKRGSKATAEPEPPSVLLHALGPRTGLILILAFLLGSVAFELGVATGKRQDEFYLPAGTANVVVLKIYGPYMIASHLDSIESKLIPPIDVIPYEQGTSLSLVTRKDLGLR